MNKEELILCGAACLLISIGGMIQIFTSYCKVDINEAFAYEAIKTINGKDFNDLADQEDASQKRNVYFSIEYPEDKQVVIINKNNKSQSTLFVENNNGLAKVVDVDFYGKKAAFSKYK